MFSLRKKAPVPIFQLLRRKYKSFTASQRPYKRFGIRIFIIHGVPFGGKRAPVKNQGAIVRSTSPLLALIALLRPPRPTSVPLSSTQRHHSDRIQVNASIIINEKKRTFECRARKRGREVQVFSLCVFVRNNKRNVVVFRRNRS